MKYAISDAKAIEKAIFAINFMQFIRTACTIYFLVLPQNSNKLFSINLLPPKIYLYVSQEPKTTYKIDYIL
ncbi:hypothetical protein HMPREF3195_01475 [Peptostreptococcus anaerobius]|uniref:Uncharacterized protein n=1 Tax=Peptostreptococcus anaerobius TaxID=1261 RepID=A0A135YNZ3_9FIRM|nr:hypothetical protein HMPREF3195_01475 [Peptostreptococcus anaerobius]